MGVVYRGYDPVIDRMVAVKTVVFPRNLPQDSRESFLERFNREARIAGKLLHPNIVVTYDSATDEATGIPFIVMELVEGETLNHRLREKGALPWRAALEVIVPIARALDYAHDNGVVHRDIKPANVILTPKGVPKLADFGIAKLPTGETTQTQTIIGTPHYMSPEQLMGKQLDRRSDIFSLGVLLYSTIAGRPPFDGPDISSIVSQVLYKDQERISKRAPDAPDELNEVLNRALEKDPDKRYATAAELAEDLVAIERGTPLVDRTLLDVGVGDENLELDWSPASAIGHMVTSSSWIVLGAAIAAVILMLLFGDELRGPTPRSTSVAADTTTVSLTPPTTPPRPVPTPVSKEGIPEVTPTEAKVADEPSEAELFYDAAVAFENGDIEESQQKLEELRETNPDLAESSPLAEDVDEELWKEALPLSFLVRHDHRIGSCRGRLHLASWGVEFRSPDHEVMRWTFDEILIMERPTIWRLEIVTREKDLLMIGRPKNYKFELIDAPLKAETWRRYRVLAEESRNK
jgi:serine/threonine protein kinase